jgi:hypothetical protein
MVIGNELLVALKIPDNPDHGFHITNQPEKFMQADVRGA